MNKNDTLAQAYLYFQHGKFDAAHALLQPLAQSRNAEVNVLHLAGASAAAVGLHSQAIGLFQRALAAMPGDVAISYKLARVLIDVGQRQEALAVYLQLMVAGVEHADVYRAAAILLYEFKRDQEALQTVQKALQLAPQSPDSLHLQAILQARLRQFPDAVHSLQQAIALAPGQMLFYVDLALALHAMHRDAEALTAIDQALALDARAVASWNARAAILSRLCRYEEAIASGERALALAPAPGDSHADVEVNLALNLLTVGQLERAWPLYEARWQGELADPLRHQQIVRWNGTDAVQGKTILLWSEQGFGDTVQFCRYVLDIAAAGARVVLEVPEQLRALLWTLTIQDDRNDRDMITVVAIGEPLPAVDLQLPLMSLPLVCATDMTSIPARPSYLGCDVQKSRHWAEVLGSEPRLRIGLVCAGNGGNRKDALRSIPLAAFAPLLDSIDADFYLLQPELRQDDHAFLQTTTQLHWPGRHLQGFDDTAALIVNLDLVISVDTAVAHVAGALGVPVWILLSHAADWRWFLDRNNSPWYPSARLFRQPQQGDWEAVMARVQSSLLGGVRPENAG
jgi:tetratricopeptide (TPR) repeat protein